MTQTCVNRWAAPLRLKAIDVVLPSQRKRSLDAIGPRIAIADGLSIDPPVADVELHLVICGWPDQHGRFGRVTFGRDRHADHAFEFFKAHLVSFHLSLLLLDLGPRIATPREYPYSPIYREIESEFVLMQHSPEVIALAIAIADEIATSDVELLCDGHKGMDGSLWYDTTSAEEDDQEALAKSVEYLAARELIVRHDSDPHQVAFRSVH